MIDFSLFHFFNNFTFRSSILDALILFSAVFFLYWLVAGVLALAAATFFPRYSHIRKKNIEIANSCKSSCCKKQGISRKKWHHN